MYWQGDHRWGREIVGFSKSDTIGRVGCLETCMAEARRLLFHDVESTPATINANAKAWHEPVFAPGSAAAIVERLAASAGLRAGPRVGVDSARALIASALTNEPRRFALLHVSHNDGNIGQHWVLATQLHDDEVTYLDPATGRVGVLSLRLLSGPSPFSSPYRVCRAAFLGAA